MNCRERVLNRLAGKPVDKIPNLNIIMTFAAKYVGVPYKKYITDYRSLVEGNIACCEAFGIDMVSTISDPYRELYGFGGNIIFPEDDVPMCTDFLVKDYSDLKKLSVKDPLKSERMLDRIRAVELFKSRLSKSYPIQGFIEGAFAEAVDLRGMNGLMRDLIEQPAPVHEMLEICTEQVIRFAEEQIKAGADFIGVGDAAASLIGPRHYQAFALPYEKRICDAIHKGGVRVKLHVCGNITSILNFMPLSGADIIDVDWMVDFGKAVNAFAGKCSANGNFDPVSVMLRGTPAEVEQAVTKCVEASNNTTCISAGCEIPKDTSFENMLTLDRTLKN